MAKYTVDVYFTDSVKHKIAVRLEEQYTVKITEENFLEYFGKELQEYAHDFANDEVDNGQREPDS